MPSHRTWIEVKKSAIRNNFEIIRSRISAKVRFLAMVKGNAWGLGTVPYAKCLADFGVDWLGVTIIEDAIELRKKDIKIPILILNEFPVDMIKKALENDIRFTIYTSEMGKRVSSIAVGMNRTANIHLKFNTGLNRIGVDLSSAIEFTRSIKNLPHILIEGIFTHYSCADQIGNDKTEKQLSAFLAIIKNLKQQGMEFSIYHSANTPAALMIPEAHLDMVRIGMGIPGLYPSEEFRTLINLEFALTWKTKVSYVRMVKSGEFVGYGCKYKCVSDTTIVTIPIGDADGMSKRFETKGNVLIRGKRYKVVAVSMDQAMVDLQGIVSDLQIGEEVVIFGTQQGNQIDPHVTAREIGADVEEILCQISTRVPRLYVQ